VQVAPRHLMRCRGEKPQESESVMTCGFGHAGHGRSGSGHTLEQGEVHERIWQKLIGFGRSGARGKTSKTIPERGKGQGGVVNQYGDTAHSGKTLKGA
jgi:hypothetical protein